MYKNSELDELCPLTMALERIHERLKRLNFSEEEVWTYLGGYFLWGQSIDVSATELAVVLDRHLSSDERARYIVYMPTIIDECKYKICLRYRSIMMTQNGRFGLNLEKKLKWARSVIRDRKEGLKVGRFTKEDVTKSRKILRQYRKCCRLSARW